MAVIRPFFATRYNPNQAPLERVVAPPYDVISPKEQDELYELSPYNCIRLILNREEKGDQPAGRYERAAHFWNEWRRVGILTQDEQPSFYLYQQEFTDPLCARRLSRTCLYAALRLEPYSTGTVIPHEETRSQAKQDRLLLMRAMKANPEPIFGLYQDDSLSVAGLINGSSCNLIPLADISFQGERHRLFRFQSEDSQRQIVERFQDKKIWIADGHHRYETALAYRDEARSPTSDGEPDYILIGLVALNDSGLVIHPTHRLVKKVSPERLRNLAASLDDDFTVTPITEQSALNYPIERHQLICALPNRCLLLSLKGDDAAHYNDAAHSQAWRNLDVVILQRLVLEKRLGIPAAALATTPDIGYTRSRQEALQGVQKGEFQAAFLLREPTVQELQGVAVSGDKMPPKSTFFYPKLLSGLVMRSLQSSEK